MGSPGAEIEIEYDEETGYRYIIWSPMVVIGMGMTAGAALEDLREAAHAGIDSIIDEEKESGRGEAPPGGGII